MSDRPRSPGRRRLLLGALAGGAAGVLGWQLARPRLVNPCHAALPPEIAEHPLVRAAWDGLDPAQVWDCHVHLAGIGDGGSGITISPTMLSPLHPLEYLQRLFYLNAGCVHDAPGQVDASYMARLENLVDAMPTGCKLMLFAFDLAHDARGVAQPALSAFHVPDAYARQVAAAAPARFEWVCSIHPYREDAVEALDAAVAGGARAVKWLPPAMGIDPASAQCDRFYAALARHDLPLISHAGEERAVHGPGDPGWGNPLRLRRALEAGVRVVMAHCASVGEDVDLDRGEHGPRVPSFALFKRLMAEPAHADRLFADISAITLRNRDLSVMREIVEQQQWHNRLLFGSDYPLPGILPLVSPAQLAAEDMLVDAAVPLLERLRDHHPILFDLVLKRLLRSRGARLADGIFETRRFFDRSPA
ncbi:amidohydrolase family protein [Denitromonas iodatirespirans]|uniref:Amidohydrolase family protein n=1 Tax=Denitromonas iodatirespirans TaxID=2795389 RepID=A0A944DQK2_DENI1|nr:amidohydrolase family protein [Denitromonas iodatirespirans]MBT0962794.1 amidohydrolase family protein [Denitromonas iodatirespirans]